MNTPISDRLANPAGDFVRNTKVVHVSHAKKLELDRAALMEALERATSGFHGSSTGYYHVDPKDIAFAKAALAAARANFPEQP